jgi:hypothetical protein
MPGPPCKQDGVLCGLVIRSTIWDETSSFGPHTQGWVTSGTLQQPRCGHAANHPHSSLCLNGTAATAAIDVFLRNWYCTILSAQVVCHWWQKSALRSRRTFQCGFLTRTQMRGRGAIRCSVDFPHTLFFRLMKCVLWYLCQQ